MHPVLQTGNQIASAIFTLAVLILGSGAFAFFLARIFGGPSRAKRQMIFTAVGGAGLVIAAGFTFFRLQGGI